MSEQATLERGYRRILAWYPRSFRADSEDEILAVLLATAADGQTRVGLAEAWDLVRGAVRMRLWPAAPRPRSVRVAVKLMLAGAAAELAAMITVIATLGRVRAAAAARDATAAAAVPCIRSPSSAWPRWRSGCGCGWPGLTAGARTGPGRCPRSASG